jgi:hypothetical protein
MVRRVLLALERLVARRRADLRLVSALSPGHAVGISEGIPTALAPALSRWVGRAAADDHIRRTFVRALLTRYGHR